MDNKTIQDAFTIALTWQSLTKQESVWYFMIGSSPGNAPDLCKLVKHLAASSCISIG